MRAWILESQTGLSALKFEERVPEPVPGPGEVVLQLSHAALNPADRYLAENQYPAKPTFPHILGRDGVGKVIAVGGGMTGVRIGDVRLILRGEAGTARWGTFADRVVVPFDDLAPKPAGWTDEEAAGAALVYLTAWQAITMWQSAVERAPTLTGKTVLVTGASGGVGVPCVQLAAAMGARVIALSRDAKKRERLLTLGAAVALDPTESGWKKTLKDQSGGKRVDLAIDNVGGPGFADLLDTMGDAGRVSVVGRLAGPVPNFNTAVLLARRLRVGGVFVSGMTPGETSNGWRQLTSILDKARQKPVVDSVFAFADLSSAFGQLAVGPMGKSWSRCRHKT